MSLKSDPSSPPASSLSDSPSDSHSDGQPDSTARAYFFGYGSLVNLSTHGFAEAHPARARGWRRAWRHTHLRPVAFLTAVPDPGCTIEGMIAHVPGDDWAALDEREHAYARIKVPDDVEHPLGGKLDVAIYAIPHDAHGRPDAAHPVLLSYLDTVVQGYLRAFGTEGAIRFFDTTSGWDAPVMDDRAAPVYPRHQPLTRTETAFVDDQLARLGVTLIPPHPV
ncbi:gamma-glutamylcyclotransferase family protein [Rhodalgimonas zhirmunskyi]|uniref:Gamma-glutamylcyclotransferase n=1 Tax=Rhodalgimonas zhirmunskyi TaxID=2964767 RepID=A0AAJ1X3U9_9RHOB|nr:gamma-glutamylcyclotransferase family protein [Rhodoalgimonas zhirmunskyi]MDQ2093668.1 gamma-glutamylcyclotransferase [Rhodoalgimonas zhirmunskyi]